jgi:ATP-dependent helicase/nuclease subunit A
MSIAELTPEQNAAVTGRGGPMLVNAGAGTGKTHVLIERVMGFILEGCSVTELPLITYTRAAAGEMRERLCRRLEAERAACPPEDTWRAEHLREQLLLARVAFMGTLHSFCLELYREFGAARSLPQGLATADEARCAMLKERALERLLEELYAGEGYGQLIDLGLDMRGDERLGQFILKAYDKSRAFPDKDEWHRRCKDAFVTKRWSGALRDWAAEKLAAWANLLEKTAGAITDIVLRHNYEEALLADAACARELQAAAKQSRKALRAALGAFSPATAGRRKGAADGPEKELVKKTREKWKDFVRETLRDRVFALPLGTAKDCAGKAMPAAAALLRAVGRFDELYSAEKLSRMLMDYQDQEDFALTILEDEETAALVSARYAQVFVDEYQDINRRQDKIVSLISGGGRNVFYVGDLRQSIYRFRMAEPNIFRERRESLPRQGGAVINLCRNYRSEPAIIHAVNHVFSRLMDRASCETDYGEPLVPCEPGPGVEWLMTEYSGFEEEDGLAAEREARSVARRLRELVNTGEFAPGDCAILLRSAKDKTPYYSAALAREGLDTVTSGDEVSRTRAALAAFLAIADNPRQDVPLLAVLQSPVYAFTASELAQLRLHSPGGSLFDCLCLSESEKSARFLAHLEELRFLAPELPVWKLVSRIAALTELDTLYGEDAREETARFERLCRSCGTDLPGFLRRYARGGFDDALPPSRKNAVRFMTIHGAKGLEFPLVVLADLKKKFNLDDTRPHALTHAEAGIGLWHNDGLSRYPTPPHHVAAQRIEWETKAEELRLLYVGMTRAKKRLILSHVEECPANSHAKALLWAAGFPAPPPQDAACFADWLLAAFDNVNWSVSFPKDEPPAVPEAEPLRDERPAPARVTLPPRPEFSLPAKLTATELHGRYPDDEAAEDTPSRPPQAQDFPLPRLGRFPRPLSAAQRGSAMHLCMQLLPFRAMDSQTVRAEINALASRRLLTPAQAKAADEGAIAAFFASPLGQRALGASKLYRECKFSLLRPAGELLALTEEVHGEILLQGVVDCFFRDDAGWALIDYKTSAYENPREHLAQLQAYASAVAAMTGAREVEQYLYYFRTGKAVRLSPSANPRRLY